MRRQKKKAIIDDGCESWLVKDAVFQLPLGIPIIKFEFDCEPEYRFASYFPQLNGGLSREIK